MALDQTITLSVDTANTGTPSDQVFSRHDDQTYPNRTDYILKALHTLAARCMLSFYRTLPKRAANFLGVAKTAFKFTQDIDVAGADPATTVQAPLILEVKFAVPVGATAAQVVELRQRAIALLDDDAIMDDVNMQQSI